MPTLRPEVYKQDLRWATWSSKAPRAHSQLPALQPCQNIFFIFVYIYVCIYIYAHDLSTLGSKFFTNRIVFLKSSSMLLLAEPTFPQINTEAHRRRCLEDSSLTRGLRPLPCLFGGVSSLDQFFERTCQYGNLGALKGKVRPRQCSQPAARQTASLGLQVYEEYLLCGLLHVTSIHFGLSGP